MARTAYWTGAALAFLAELGSLGALAAAGWALPEAVPARVVLAVGLPVAAAVLWGLFAAPRAAHPSRLAAAATVVLVEGGAAVALVLLGAPVLAGVLVAAVLAGRVLTARPPAGVNPAA